MQPLLSTCSADGAQPMSDLSVYWMLVPYFLVGVAESMISPQLYDLCYNEVPDDLRSTAQAMNLFMNSVSGAIAGALSKACAKYVRADLNESHIEYEYYAAAGLAAAALPAFILVARRFRYSSRYDDGTATGGGEGGTTDTAPKTIDSKSHADTTAERPGLVSLELTAV